MFKVGDKIIHKENEKKVYTIESINEKGYISVEDYSGNYPPEYFEHIHYFTILRKKFWFILSIISACLKGDIK